VLLFNTEAVAGSSILAACQVLMLEEKVLNGGRTIMHDHTELWHGTVEPENAVLIQVVMTSSSSSSSEPALALVMPTT
jgi:hypothetical protein